MAEKSFFGANMVHYLSIEQYRARLNNCGNKYVLLECKDCQQKYFVPLSCGLRSCPKCAKRYNDNFSSNLWDKIGELKVSRYIKFRHIVLNWGTDGTLEYGVYRSFKAWLSIWNTYFKGSGCGAIAFLEFGEKNQSVHLHVLFYGKYIPQEKLKKWWFARTGKWNVFIRRATGKGAIREVVKYINKGISTNDFEKNYEIESVLFGRKRIRRYGVFIHKKGEPLLNQKKLTCSKCGNYAFKCYTTHYWSEIKKRYIYTPIIFDKQDIRTLKSGLLLSIYRGAVFKAMSVSGLGIN